MKNVIIIDALNMFLRSYVISPHLNKKGWPIGGTIGFLKSLQKVARDFDADEIIVASIVAWLKSQRTKKKPTKVFNR